MNGGLAALLGILKGAEGLPEGMIAADKQRNTEAQLAESQRHAKALEDQAYVDLPPDLQTKWGLKTPRIRKELAPIYSAGYEKSEARRVDSEKNAALDRGLAELENVTRIDRSGAMAEPEAAGIPAPEVTTKDPQMSMLRRLLPAIGHEKATPVVVELLKERAGGGKGGMTAHYLQDGRYVSFADKNGNFTPPQPTGLEAPQNRGPFTREDIERLLTERGWRKDEPGWAEAYANVARQIPVSGVGAFGAGQFVIPPPPRGQQSAAGAPRPAATPAEGLQSNPLVGAQQSLSAEQTTNLADFRTLLGQMDKIEKAYDPKYIGPIKGRLGALRTMVDVPQVGLGATPEESNLRAEIKSVQNSIVYLKSGKQINESEFQRLMAELPDPNDPPVVFTTKLQRAKALLQDMLANREAEYRARQFRGGAPAGAPASTPAAPSTGGWGKARQVK